MSAPGLSSLVRYAADLDGIDFGPAPPVEKWDPPDRGPIDIRIRADGAWLHEGAVIERARLVRLFSSILRRDGEAYYLVTPAEKRRIAVGDAPFVAVAMRSDGDGAGRSLEFSTNLGERIAAGPDHPITFRPFQTADAGAGGVAPYILVRGGLEARLARSVYYDFAALAEAGSAGLGVWSNGVFFTFPEA